MKRLSLVAVLLIGVSAYADAPVTVLGLPLGGKMAVNMKICPSNTDKAKEVCWISKPFTGKSGDRLGSVHLPNPDLRPTWATYAMFEIYAGKDGELKQLKVHTFDGKEKHTIANSITSRFGLPKETTLPRDGLSSAKWVRDDIFISMICADECWVEFRSPKVQAERELEASEAQRRQLARPVSP